MASIWHRPCSRLPLLPLEDNVFAILLTLSDAMLNALAQPLAQPLA